MDFLTDKDREEIEAYNMLSKKDKRLYLKEHNMIILNEYREKDSKDVFLNIEFNTSFYKKLMKLKKEDETAETCISRLIAEAVNCFDKNVKEEIVEKPVTKKNATKKSKT
jgi:hypothetical protein